MSATQTNALAIYDSDEGYYSEPSSESSGSDWAERRKSSRACCPKCFARRAEIHFIKVKAEDPPPRRRKSPQLRPKKRLLVVEEQISASFLVCP
jgi:hypothetical protein